MCKVAWTSSHATSLNWSGDRMPKSLNRVSASVWSAWNRRALSVSDVFFRELAKRKQGSRGRGVDMEPGSKVLMIHHFAATSNVQFSCAGRASFDQSLLSSWCAFTWWSDVEKERFWPCSRITFRMSVCFQFGGELQVANLSTVLGAPWQSEKMSTVPNSPGRVISMLCNMRCMVIKPRSSPLYAYAEGDVSVKERESLLPPEEHSSMTAAVQILGCISHM